METQATNSEQVANINNMDHNKMSSSGKARRTSAASSGSGNSGTGSVENIIVSAEAQSSSAGSTISKQNENEGRASGEEAISEAKNENDNEDGQQSNDNQNNNDQATADLQREATTTSTQEIPEPTAKVVASLNQSLTSTLQSSLRSNEIENTDEPPNPLTSSLFTSSLLSTEMEYYDDDEELQQPLVHVGAIAAIYEEEDVRRKMRVQLQGGTRVAVYPDSNDADADAAGGGGSSGLNSLSGSAVATAASARHRNIFSNEDTKCQEDETNNEGGQRSPYLEEIEEGHSIVDNRYSIDNISLSKRRRSSKSSTNEQQMLQQETPITQDPSRGIVRPPSPLPSLAPTNVAIENHPTSSVQFYSVEAVAVPLTNSDKSEDSENGDGDEENPNSATCVATQPITPDSPSANNNEQQVGGVLEEMSGNKTTTTVYDAVLVKAWYKDPKKLCFLVFLFSVLVVGAGILGIFLTRRSSSAALEPSLEPTLDPTFMPTSSPTQPPPPPIHGISTITQLQKFFSEDCNKSGKDAKCWPYIEVNGDEVVVAPLTIKPNSGEALVNITWGKQIHVFRKRTASSIAINDIENGNGNHDAMDVASLSRSGKTNNGTIASVTATDKTMFELVQVINTTYEDKPFQAGDIDIHEDVMVVGSGWENLETGAVYVYERRRDTNGTSGMGLWEQVQRISPNDIYVDAEFGWDVEIYNDIMVIAALQDREGSIGSAYIYRRNPDTGSWEFEHKLAPSNDEGKIFNFGTTIAIQGNRIAVGDRRYKTQPKRKGAVWLYEYNQTSKEWTQPYGDVMTSELCDNWFGAMVAFTHDFGLLVGCAQDDNNAGSIHYYEPSETGYDFKQKIVASKRAKRDFFGDTDQISVHGNVMAVGLNSEKNGRVYIFLRQGGVWVEETMLESPSEESQKFGNRVRLSGNNIIVSSLYNSYFYELAEDSSRANCIALKAKGAISDDCTTCVKGPFVALDGEYAVVSKDKESLQILSGENFKNEELRKNMLSERFGGVAISGTVAVAGMPNVNNNNGKVGLYEYNDRYSFWQGPWELSPSVVTEKEHFGYAVDVDSSSNAIIIGAHDYIGKTGSAYIFRYDELNYIHPYWGQEVKLLPQNDTNLQGFGQAVSVSDDTVAIGDRSYKGSTGAVFVYEYDQSSKEWSMHDPITNSECDDMFGASLTLTAEGGLMIGCPGEHTKMGAVYYYYRPRAGVPFKLHQKIQFGGPNKIAVDEHIMVVTEKVDTGTVHIFSKTSGNLWVEIETIRSPPDVTYFGLNVALFGRRVLVSSAHNVYSYSYELDDACKAKTISSRPSPTPGAWTAGATNNTMAITTASKNDTLCIIEGGTENETSYTDVLNDITGQSLFEFLMDYGATSYDQCVEFCYSEAMLLKLTSKAQVGSCIGVGFDSLVVFNKTIQPRGCKTRLALNIYEETVTPKPTICKEDAVIVHALNADAKNYGASSPDDQCAQTCLSDFALQSSSIPHGFSEGSCMENGFNNMLQGGKVVQPSGSNFPLTVDIFEKVQESQQSVCEDGTVLVCALNADATNYGAENNNQCAESCLAKFRLSAMQGIQEGSCANQGFKKLVKSDMSFQPAESNFSLTVSIYEKEISELQCSEGFVLLHVVDGTETPSSNKNEYTMPPAPAVQGVNDTENRADLQPSVAPSLPGAANGTMSPAHAVQGVHDFENKTFLEPSAAPSLLGAANGTMAPSGTTASKNETMYIVVDSNSSEKNETEQEAWPTMTPTASNGTTASMSPSSNISSHTPSTSSSPTALPSSFDSINATINETQSTPTYLPTPSPASKLGTITNGRQPILSSTTFLLNLLSSPYTMSHSLEFDTQHSRYGSSVAISNENSIVAVGAKDAKNENGVTTGAVYLYKLAQNNSGADFSASNKVEIASKLMLLQILYGNAPKDEFGNAVAMSSDGSRLIVGSRSEDSNRGAVRVYERRGSDTGAEWTLMDEEGGFILGETLGAREGWAVAISAKGDVVVMGSPKGGTRGGGSVRTIIYNSDLSKWEERYGTVGGDQDTDATGYSVSLGERTGSVTMVIGSIKASGNAGKFAAYSMGDSKGWEPLGQEVYGKSEGDTDGTSVAISADGTVVVVGGKGHNKVDPVTGEVLMNSVGHCHVFIYREPSQWEMQHTIVGKVANERLGSSVAVSLDGNVVACGGVGGVNNYRDSSSSGIPVDPLAATDTTIISGVVRLYNTVTEKESTLWPRGDAATVKGSSFGSSVALSSDGGQVVVGAPTWSISHVNKDGGPFVGAIQIFQVS